MEPGPGTVWGPHTLPPALPASQHPLVPGLGAGDQSESDPLTGEPDVWPNTPTPELGAAGGAAAPGTPQRPDSSTWCRLFPGALGWFPWECAAPPLPTALALAPLARAGGLVGAGAMPAAPSQDCLQGIRGHLKPYQSVLSTLSGIGLALTGCAVLLSAFLWFAVRSGRSLDRKGKYTLAARAHGCQPQEPGFFRHSQDGPATRTPSGADAAGDSEALGGSRTMDMPLRPLSCRRLPSACRDP